MAYASGHSVDAHGNETLQTGSYVDSGGVQRELNDVWFVVDTARSLDMHKILVGGSAVDMTGFGNVADLSQVVSQDSTGDLKQLLQRFAEEADSAARTSLLDDIIFAWSGAAQYGSNSRGGFIDDGRKLYALEAFLGREFTQGSGTNGGTPNPGPNAAAKLMKTYDTLAGFIYSGLMLQTHFKPLVAAVGLSFVENRFEFDVTPVVAQLQADYSANPSTGTQVMVEFFRSLLDAGEFGASVLSRLRQAGDVTASGFSYLLGNAGNSLGGVGGDELYGDAGDNSLLGLSGQDTLYGGAGNDILEGGADNDYLSGDEGADVYKFSRGWGQDTLNNFESGVNQRDVVEFGGNIVPDDLLATRSGDDLILALRGTSDRLKVVNYFLEDGASAYYLDAIRFADGTEWNFDQIKVMVVVETSGNDEIHGYASSDNLSGGLGNDSLYGAQGDDVLQGGGGNDFLNGGVGSDTYLFDLGDGQDVISDTGGAVDGTDVLRFGPGIQAADISVSHADGNLVLSHSNGLDRVIVSNWFNVTDGRYRVERIEFSDGTVWTSTALTAALLTMVGSAGDDVLTGPGTGNQSLSGLAGNDVLTSGAGNDVLDGGSGNDTLNASAGNDQLSGGQGNDVLNGGTGSDVYLFGLGDGRDIINDDTAYYSGNVDVLRFGAGISASDISVSRSGNHVILAHGNGQDQVTIQNWFASNDDRYRLERIEFADGTLWTSATVSAQLLVITGSAGDDVLAGPSTGNQTLSGLAGNDTLTGSSGNDVLEGGQGNDLLNGGSGSDVYLFGLGDGRDIINDDTAYYSGNVDVLRFGTGISASDISISRSGNHVVLAHSNGQDQVTLQNWFTASDDRYKLERIEFADGTLWTSATVSASLLVATGSEGDDVLSGPSTGNQSLSGLAGNDTLTSGSGNDVLDGGSGNDTLNANAGNDQLSGGQGNDVLNGGTGSDLYLFGLGDGRDIINDDTAYYSGNVDVLRFGAGISASDISVSRSGNHVILAHSNGQDQVTIQNWFTASDDRYKLERIEFADGAVWSSSYVSELSLALNGTAGDDVLVGPSTGNQTIRGLTGNDTLTSGSGNDVLDGGSGNDTLNANAGNDQLSGGQGDDVLNGGTGSDLYLFELGDGRDIINDDTAYYSGNVDVLRFGAGISASDITISRSGDHVILAHSNGQDQVTIRDWFSASDDRYKLERIEFSDGTLWTSATVSAPLLVATGSAGDDVLSGPSTGNQSLSGLAGNDTLNSGSGNDVLDGGSGNDTLNANAGNDQLSGGQGNDVLNGGTGSDLYLFGLGDGRDIINDDTAYYSGNIDVLRFGAGISTSDISVSRSGNHVILAHSNGQDQVTIQNWFTASDDRYKLERIEFADGAVWSSSYVSELSLALNGTAGDDVLVGPSTGNQTIRGLTGNDTLTSGSGNDVLDGGSGNDTLNANAGNDQLSGGQGDDVLNGGTGSDLYLFELGDGRDIINDDTAYYSGNVDVLRFGAGISASDITISRSGDHVILAHSNGQDQVTIRNWFASGDDRYKLERIEFADGTSWNSAAVAAPLLTATGSAGNDVLTGPSTGNQTLSGLAGNDTLTSGSGNDVLDGGSGNDTLNANAGNDQLSGGQGDDVLNGGTGSDLYLFELGDGRDIINDDTAYYSGNIDVLRFGAGISVSDITISRSGDHVILAHSNGQDQVTIRNWFASGDDRYKLERIEFADGTSWNSAAVAAPLLVTTGSAGNDVLTGPSTGNQTLSGLAGNDTLTSGSGNDVLDGGSGNDTLNANAGNDQLSGGQGDDVLNGGTGSDLYLFELGDGRDIINDDTAYYSGNVDVLRFGAGISASDISISRSGDHVILAHSNGQDQVTLRNWFTSSDDRYKLERIEFADGTSWNSAAVAAPLLVTTGSTGDDVLTGPSTGNQTLSGLAGNDTLTSGSGNDVLDGGSGNDTLNANAGNDQLSGGQGNDVLNGGTGSDLYLFELGDGRDIINDDTAYYSGNIDVLRFGAGISTSDISVSRSGNHVILAHSNGQDQVTVQNWFTTSDDRYKLERIEFADGASWTSAQVASRASTAGNDTITGSSSNDRLQGGKGNDLLQGGEGSDRYVFIAGDGQDIINNLSTSPNDVDVLGIEGLTAQSLWFSRDNDSLVIDARGSEDRITIKDWYVGQAQQVDVIQAGSQALYANAVDSLVSAMAAFGAPAGGEIILNQTQQEQLNAVIATHWSQ
ncbi:calcium-binding protein [Pseudomonas japonica]|uniref:calcium-binding protein n=1 Tax=Pseudomonas japonica TaxID=256466 RepID=UPI00382E72F7